MNNFTREMVDEYANKLLIGLTEEENKLVLKEFNIIDASMQLIEKFPDIKKIEPMTHALDSYEYELKEETGEVESIEIEDLLKNCGCYEEREIKVPRVIN